MPAKFKGLASIGAWVLFIMGLILFLFGWIIYFRAMAAGLLEDVAKLAPWCTMDSFFVLGTIMITLSVCVMVLRRKLE
jgi:hypothetical protein